ncbi:DUF3224 domain-containing protein [Massilia pseudoviolaceinigra]|uniref:DUF3224 domain-containing protein n=1 Tax=Massilia pseudoviolaceinigra TaxID=3057165 RepID=UPI0027969E57|nr:DUF3224 domain-containing protein [Massilia sp. CCM 9206]MDQ1923773.1 DUF3224 domain-containing protein [Massilia sp. CCM 9206]
MSLFRFSAVALSLLAFLQPAAAQTSPAAPPMLRASGPFEIAIIPAGAPEKEGRTAIARMALDKQYGGALAATGKGTMLTAVSDTKGSAAYVAIERVSGTLAGRKGSFVLQHAGTMQGGTSRALITIVPDSGTEELSGITGSLALTVVDGKHFYALDYALGH